MLKEIQERKDLNCFNPATGDFIGSVPISTSAEVYQARSDMAKAAPMWAAKPLTERIRLLKQLQAVLIDSLDEITMVVNKDAGKSRQDALIEVFITVDILHRTLANAQKWLKRQSVSPGLYLTKRTYIEQEPYGTVAIISPWNFPFMLAMQPALNALIAGNTIILKPSEVTAMTGQLIERLFKRVPTLSSYVRVVHGDGAVGAALVESKPDLIYMTGSTETGKKIAQAAAEHLIPTIFELGGKDPMIVTETANLKAAAKWGVWASCFNAGQACAGIERMYVVDSVYNQFVRLVVEEAKQFTAGYSDEIKDLHHMGPLSSEAQARIVDEHIQDAIDKGARILTGDESNGFFFEATVLVDVDHSMDIMNDETFGPVIPIMRVKDAKEAVKHANQSQFGLGASVWGNVPEAEKLLRQLRAGTKVTNDAMAQFAIPYLPFGGVKQSGNGRSHGQQDLLQFTQSISYAVARPPLSIDPSVMLREPGKYRLGEALLKLVFGTPRQKLEPVVMAAKSQGAKSVYSKILGPIGKVAALVTGIFAATAVYQSRQKR